MLDKQAQSSYNIALISGAFMDNKTQTFFRKNLSLLEKLGLLITQEYPIESRLTNWHFMHDHLPKTRLKSLAALFKRNNKFILKSLSKKSVDIEKTCKLKGQIADFHKYLTGLHVDKYCQNRTDSWNYLGLAIHYLLDCYYHVYLQAFAANPVCSWCQTQPADWDEFNNFVLNDRLIKAFIYFNLAQEIWLQNDITSEVINHYLDNMKFLVEKSIKDGIMKTPDPSLNPCSTTG